MYREVWGKLAGVGSLCHIGLRDCIQIIRLGCKHPHPLSHLISPQHSCLITCLHYDTTHAKYWRISSRSQSFRTQSQRWHCIMATALQTGEQIQPSVRERDSTKAQIKRNSDHWSISLKPPTIHTLPLAHILRMLMGDFFCPSVSWLLIGICCNLLFSFQNGAPLGFMKSAYSSDFTEDSFSSDL